jgi:hypothetical protein
MVNLDFMNRFSVRRKVNLAVVPVLLLAGLIAGMSFVSHRRDAISNSHCIIGLVLASHGDALGRELAGYEGQFAAWAAEDAWGMSIEYDLTAELGDRFAKLSEAAPAFALIVLTDRDGKILAGGHGGKSDLGELSGSKNPDSDWVAHLGAGQRYACVTTSKLLARFASTATSRTFALAAPVAGSGGDISGYLFAYVDWSNIEADVNSTRDQLTSVGYPHAATMFVSQDGAGILACAGLDEATPLPTDIGHWLADSAHAGSALTCRYASRGQAVRPRTPPSSASSGSCRRATSCRR